MTQMSRHTFYLTRPGGRVKLRNARSSRSQLVVLSTSFPFSGKAEHCNEVETFSKRLQMSKNALTGSVTIIFRGFFLFLR